MDTKGHSLVQISKSAQVVMGKHGAILYHSLFAKPLFVSHDVVDFLQLFRCPKAIEETDETRRFVNSNVFGELVRNYLLIGPNLNERSLLKERVKKHCETLQAGGHLRRLDLSVSESCNLRCPHCIHFNSIKDTRKPAVFMTWETAKIAIDKYVEILKKNGLTESEIHFGTAEPLLNWPVMKRVLEYCMKIYPYINHRFYIDTNLLLLTQEVAEILRDYKVSIVTSIDGDKKANDAIRGEGTFDKIVEKCQLLLDVGYPLKGFIITITDRNLHLLTASIIDWAHGMSMTGIDMDPDLISSTNLPVEQYIEKILLLHKRCLELGLETTGTWKMPFLNLINRNPLEDVDPPALCRSAKGQNIAVAPNGNLYICGHSSTTVGNLYEFDTLFKDGGPFLQLIKSRLSGQNEMCVGCEIEGQCAGQCQVTCEVACAQKTNKIKWMCDFYRKITRSLLLKKLEKEFRASGEKWAIQCPTPEPET